MRVFLYDDEWYPVASYYEVGEAPWMADRYTAVEVPDAVIRRYERAEKAFDDAADELRKFFPTGDRE